MSTTIHNRFDPAKNFDAIKFRQDKVLQSAELNELQSMATARVRGIADALFRDGDVVRDARIVINSLTGAVQAEAGAIYLQGAVRGVPTGEFSVPVAGIVNVGIYLIKVTVTEVEDPSLLNPAGGTPAYQEPGAWREKVQPVWGFAGDGGDGEFFPVWVVEDGFVRAKEAPPNLDAVTQALARYDRDSAGGSYIVDGLEVVMAADLPSGEQVFTVAEGRARVAGYPIELQAGRRLVAATAAELLLIDSEPHQSTTAGAQRIDISRPPCKGVPQVRITSRKTVNIVHGGFAGAADPLPDATVIQIEKVQQGATVYKTDGSDYKLTAAQVDWSPGGAEVAPGSNYSVTYLYVATIVPTAVDSRGCTVEGAVPGTLMLVTYQQQLRRIDRLCLTRDGAFEWLRGISSPWKPTAPVVPDDMLAIASVYQTWDAERRVVNDAVKVVPMAQLLGYRERLDSVILDLAELRLASSAQGLDSGIKKGIFADPFLSDDQRDAGIAQTAAIVRGSLQLPITPTVFALGANLPERMAPAHGYRVVLAQTMRTGAMLVNPYRAFEPIPAAVTLTPNVDRWTDIVTQWASPVTERLYTGSGTQSSFAGSGVSSRVLSEKTTDIETLRPTTVRFDLAGWGPGEALGAVTFDGLAVQAAALPGRTLVASANGELSGTFVVPANVPAGARVVQFSGPLGSKGSQTYMGQGTTLLRTQQQVTTETWALSYPAPVSTGGAVFGPSGAGTTPTQINSKCSRWLYDGYFDPLAETFVLDELTQCAGIDLPFTAVGGPVVVQIRETANGVPSQAVVVEARVAKDAIQLQGFTRISWPPVLLQARREYAIVVLCDDATTAVAIAELGKQDPTAGYVTSQPYQVGVLLSSSNASTWTAHHDRDLCFRLLGAQYSENERVIDLGTANLVAATDLMVLGFAERPSAAANLFFEVQFPAEMQNEVVRLTDGQVVWLAAPFTGQVHVRARISGDATLAAVLQAGMQMVAGHIEATGTYVSRTVAADANSRVKVVFEADIPGGSAVQVHVQGSQANAPWVLVPYVTVSTTTAGVREITHQLENFNAGAGARVRLTLTGGTTARPQVRNLRCVVL
ncbi:DUF4815 domain-containing protein [Acidovorax sp. SUPP3334]|uniref:DUF4815 domain-containing protein n=1 Tax=Acidovorax sp. SUPP3334 TaxID=2920881 RepID=UPI0023DE6126|nr:DUF4815 domain-containing protein [Acidovorax sp. SUPP3334]GKT21641.1 DUF4815 domain-containing protein [Acidovorax sp. SUPP3334]